MSFSRSPSPRIGSGWTSPGLNVAYNNSTSQANSLGSYRSTYRNGKAVTWETTTSWNGSSRKDTSFFNNRNFFTRFYTNLRNSLPFFNLQPQKFYDEKEKFRSGRWTSKNRGRLARLTNRFRITRRKTKIRLLMFIGVISMVILFYVTREYSSCSY